MFRAVSTSCRLCSAHSRSIARKTACGSWATSSTAARPRSPHCASCVIWVMARAQGSVKAREDDTLGDVIAAPDRDSLLDWLRHRPMMHVAADCALVHAG